MTKKYAKPIFFAALMLCPFSTFGGGVPVFDPVSHAHALMEAMARAKEFEEAINHSKNKLNHYKDMVEGHFNFEDILNDISHNKFMALDQWDKIYQDQAGLEKLRRKYNMYSRNPAIQKKYDDRLKQHLFNEKVYKSTVSRNKRMNKLLAQLPKATTPSAKEDIANAIQLEQLKVKNDKLMMDTLTSLMEKQQMLEHEAQEKEKIRIMFNEGFPRSTNKQNKEKYL